MVGGGFSVAQGYFMTLFIAMLQVCALIVFDTLNTIVS